MSTVILYNSFKTTTSLIDVARRHCFEVVHVLRPPCDRTQQISFDGHLSPIMPVPYDVPQGSVLGPLLFVMYTADLSRVVTQHGLSLHQYADDCQVSFIDCQRRANLGRPIRSLYWRRGRLAERQPVTFETKTQVLYIHTYIHVYLHKVNAKCEQNHDKHAGQKGWARDI